MNILEELKECYPVENKHIVDFNAGWHECLEIIQAEYDSLCPKPSEFNQMTEINGLECIYFTIDADGTQTYHDTKPNSNNNMWEGDIDSIETIKRTDIPLGLDWRLCVWSLEDAKRIHGEKQ